MCHSVKNSNNLLLAHNLSFNKHLIVWKKNQQKTFKKRLNWPKKVFRPAFGYEQHPKAGQNMQHPLFSLKSAKNWPISIKQIEMH